MFSGDKDSGSNQTTSTTQTTAAERDAADAGWDQTLKEDGLKEGWNNESGQWGIQSPEETEKS